MGLADLHIHTTHSFDGTANVTAVLRRAASQRELNVIAITDHDAIDGALEAQELAPLYGIEVVPGVEISTREGHLLGLFIEQMVPAGLPLMETIERVGDLGGLCVAPHPFGRRGNSLSALAVTLAVEHPRACDILVGIEVFNGGVFSGDSNRIAGRFASHMDVARLGSSDAHVLSAIGSGVTRFQGSTSADLRRALQARTTEAVRRIELSPLRLAANWMGWRLLRGVGWAASSAAPQAPLVTSPTPPTPEWPVDLESGAEVLSTADWVELSS